MNFSNSIKLIVSCYFDVIINRFSFHFNLASTDVRNWEKDYLRVCARIEACSVRSFRRVLLFYFHMNRVYSISHFYIPGDPFLYIFDKMFLIDIERVCKGAFLVWVTPIVPIRKRLNLSKAVKPSRTLGYTLESAIVIN